LKVLDIGTGSGCIAIALAKNLSNSAVFAIDVSIKALATAELNAKKNEVNVTFIEKNILNTSDLAMQFDIIVSNPPYVRNLEKGNMQKNVLENEPHLALFVDDEDPLVFYRKIADLAKRSLSKNGQLYFEINQYLGDDMIFLLQNKGFKNVALRRDIYGSHRMIKAIRG
jgi:release factor glutamine methyltransferase